VLVALSYAASASLTDMVWNWIGELATELASGGPGLDAL